MTPKEYEKHIEQLTGLIKDLEKVSDSDKLTLLNSQIFTANKYLSTIDRSINLMVWFLSIGVGTLVGVGLLEIIKSIWNL